MTIRQESEQSTEGSSERADERQGLYCHPDFFTFKAHLDVEGFQVMMKVLGYRDMPVDWRNGVQSSLAVTVYENSFSSQDCTLRGGYTDVEDDRIDAFVCLSGGYFDRLDSFEQYDLIRILIDQFKVTPTRFDTTITDYGKEAIRLEDFEEAINDDNYSGFQVTQLIENRARTKGVINKTRYLGSRKSNKFGRVYLHDGYPRFEVERRGKDARLAVNMALSFVTEIDPHLIESQWQQAIGGLAVGAFQFCDRSARTDTVENERNLSRCPNLPFWQQIIDAIGQPIKVRKGSASKNNLDKSIAWLNHQVIMTLKVLKKICSRTSLCYKELMNTMSKRANVRWNIEHDFKVDSYLWQLKEALGELPTTDALLLRILGEDTNMIASESWLNATS